MLAFDVPIRVAFERPIHQPTLDTKRKRPASCRSFLVVQTTPRLFRRSTPPHESQTQKSGTE
jgi:hypothetical protein